MTAIFVSFLQKKNLRLLRNDEFTTCGGETLSCCNDGLESRYDRYIFVIYLPDLLNHIKMRWSEVPIFN